jgi:outer membrane protein OmpA-like peptidoglycan-associated protein
MKRVALSVLTVLLVIAAISLVGCAGSLGSLEKRVDTLGRSLKSLEVAHEETAQLAVSTSFNVDQIKDSVDETNRMVAQIGDQINFIPEEAMRGVTSEDVKATKPAAATTTKVTEPANAPSKAKAEVKTAPTTLEGKLAALSKRVDAHEEKLKRHDSQLGELLRRLAEAEDELGRPVYLWTEPFPSGKPNKPGDKEEPQLPDELKPGLDDLAFAITQGKVELSKRVFGHADPTGNEKDNLELSERRAQACINHLVTRLGPDKDVPWQNGTQWKDYFEAVGQGETDHYGDYRYNRRVCFQRS